MRVYCGNDVVRQWFGRHDKTVDRKHDAAQLALEVVVGVAGKNDGIGRNRPVLRNDPRAVAVLDTGHR